MSKDAAYSVSSDEVIDGAVDRTLLLLGEAAALQRAEELAALLSAALAQPVPRERFAERAAAAEAARLGPLAVLPKGIAQRTPEWLEARRGMITASDAAQAMGCGKFGTQRDFYVGKCFPPAASVWSSSAALPPPLKWGTMYEPVAACAYRLRSAHKAELHEFGLLQHADLGFLGASPDGINDLGVMVELKCPYRRKIVEGQLPMQYYYQIQQQLDVCGLDACDYFEVELEEHGAWDALRQDGLRGFVIEDGSGAGEGQKYVYSDPPCSSEDTVALADLRAQAEALAGEATRLHLFTVRRASLLRVRKDADVVSEMRSSLSEVWKQVLRYRSDPQAYEREVTQASRRRKKTEEPAAPSSSGPPRGYAFVKDDDEEEEGS